MNTKGKETRGHTLILPQPPKEKRIPEFYDLSAELKAKGLLKPTKSMGTWAFSIDLDKVTQETLPEILKLLTEADGKRLVGALKAVSPAVPMDISEIYHRIKENFPSMEPVRVTADVVRAYQGKDKNNNGFTAVTLTQSARGTPDMTVYLHHHKLTEPEIQLLENLKQDQRVTVTGKVTFYDKNGTIQILGTAVSPAEGKSLYQTYIEEEEKKWIAAGKPQQNLPGNRLGAVRDENGRLKPKSVVVITPENAQGYEDFSSTINKNAFDLYQPEPIRLTAENIIKTMQELDPKEFDVLVILRGGGSRYDLMEFSDSRLACAIGNYPVPVICAIGHETDNPLCQFAASHYSATPTAAAKELTAFYYAPLNEERKLKAKDNQNKKESLAEENQRLQEENEALKSEIDRLNAKITAISLTKNLVNKVKKLTSFFGR